MQNWTQGRTPFHELYQEYRPQFKKPADSLVFYIHWYMLKNGFDSIIDTKSRDHLTKYWNKCPDYYDNFYRRENEKYRLRFHLYESSIYLTISRNDKPQDLSNEYIDLNVDTFINAEQYNNPIIKYVYKKLPRIEKKLDSIFKPEKIRRSNSIIEIDVEEFDNKENQSNSSIQIIKRKVDDKNILGESIGSFLEKMNPPKIKKSKITCDKEVEIKLFSSVPIKIGLFDENNNQHSIGSLYNHLFVTKTSPCILCSNCNKFLSIIEFTKHSHNNEFVADNLKISSFSNETIDDTNWNIFNNKINQFSLNEFIQQQKPNELFKYYFMDPADRDAAIEFFKNFDDSNIFF